MPHRPGAAVVHRWSCIAFVALTATTYVIAELPAAVHGSAYIALHLLLTMSMLAAWISGCVPGALNLRATLAAAVIARLCLVAVPTFTTHDIDRYLWDGAVVLAGFDPYVLAPQSTELADLHLRWPTPPEHAAYATLYPPMALTLFALCAQAGPAWAPWLWKLAVAAASLATVGVSLALLRRYRLLQHLPLVALSPLLVLESGVGGHVDAFSTLCIALAFLFCSRRQAMLAGMALGLGAAIKLLPAIALLPIAFGLGARRAIRLLCGAAIVLVASYALARAAGWQAIGSLPVFFERWRFGAPLFAALQNLLPATVAAALLLCAAVALLGFAAHRARSDLVTGAQISLATPLLLGPVAFPWYLSALIPGLALRPRAWLLAWISTVPLTYEVLNRFNDEGRWMPADWPLWIIAIAVGAGIVFDAVKWRPGSYSFRLQS